MKDLFKLFAPFLFLITNLSLFSQVAINEAGAAPDASAVFDVASTEKGILIPRMSAAERDAITSPASGLMVFVNDDNRFWIYNGSGWEKVMAGADAGWERSGDDVVTAAGGNIGIGTSSPGEKLELAGNIYINSSEPMIHFGNNSGTTDRMIIRKNPSNFGEINVLSNEQLRLRTNDTDRLIIDANGDIDMQGNQLKSFRIENRTSDPASPAVGQMWIRTDL